MKKKTPNEQNATASPTKTIKKGAYRLIALDLDGTLFNNSCIVTPPCREAIAEAIQEGIHVVVSTGRPLSGVSRDRLKGTGIRYAITTNGAGIYDMETKKALSVSTMSSEEVAPILRFLETKDIHMDVFVNGNAFSRKDLSIALKLELPEATRRYILDTRIRVDGLTDFITGNQIPVQKITLNFEPLGNGRYRDRDEVKAFLDKQPNINVVCGGYHNLEFTKAGISKGTGLRDLAKALSVPMEETMAVGDSENDLSILEAAAVGVAMANASDDVKAAADLITASNEEDGVAKLFRQWVLPR